MEKKIEIRKLVAEDYKAYIALSEQLDEYHRIALPEYFKKPDEEFRTLEVFLKQIADHTILLSGAFADGKLVGYSFSFFKETPAVAVKLARKFVLLDAIVVDNNCKRIGIGKKLYEDVSKFAKENST